jgi:hypothetical protein
MGFEEMIQEGEQALSGQTSADQQAANQKTGGNMSMEDTMVDSGENPSSSSAYKYANVPCAI